MGQISVAELSSPARKHNRATTSQALRTNRKIFLAALLVATCLVLSWLHHDGRLPKKLESVVPRVRANRHDGASSITPHEYQPRRWQSRHGGPFRVLIVSSYLHYLTSMDTRRSELMDAMRAHPDIMLDVWGDNWNGWIEGKSLSQNVELRKLPGDLARPEYPSGPVGCGFYDVWISFEGYAPWVADIAGCGTVRYQQLGDCHHDNCIDQLAWRSMNITSSGYGTELIDQLPYERIKSAYPDMAMQLFTYNPDAANTWDFYPGRWSERTQDAVLLGSAFEFYPIRQTVENAIRESNTNIVRMPHAGYELEKHAKAAALPMDTYRANLPAQQKPLLARQMFAEQMRTTKICVFDSSLQRKMIRKYAQALLSGCVIAADLPTEQEEALSDFVIVLQPEWTIDEINVAINDALADPMELQRKSAAGLAYARQHLTWTRHADRIIQAVQEYKAGARGYSFYEPISLKCRKYWWRNENGTEPMTPPWCQGSRDLEERHVQDSMRGDW